MAKKNQKDDVTQDVQTAPEEQVQTDAVYIAVDDLTAEQTLTLAEDPWLELVPVCED